MPRVSPNGIGSLQLDHPVDLLWAALAGIPCWTHQKVFTFSNRMTNLSSAMDTAAFSAASALPLRGTTSRPSHCRARRRPPTCLARGFAPQPPPTPPSGAPRARTDASPAGWADKYEAYVARNGELLCAMAWEGYEKLGRGAVFTNYDSASANVGFASAPGGAAQPATPSFYVDRDQLLAKNARDDIPQMAPILSRIADYDPQTQFVVVFEADGTQGADIVTPNQRPSDVWARTRKDGGKMFDWGEQK